MSVELPNIEDRIQNLFLDIIREDWMTEEEVHLVLNESLKSMDMTMDKLLKQFIIGVEHGYSIEEQFEVIKKIFGNE